LGLADFSGGCWQLLWLRIFCIGSKMECRVTGGATGCGILGWLGWDVGK